MRGLFLFNDLSTTEEVQPKLKSQGRNKDLIGKRNECLLDRLWFYKTQFRWEYNYVLEKLSDEFFISENTIPKILERPESQLYLRNLKLQGTDKNTFAKKWPHFKWAA